jgi:integrase
MNYDYFEYRYSKAKKLIGCESIDSPAHSLRKFGATQYANSGANLNELSEWLGDSSIEAIKRYVKTTGRAQDLANKMKFDEK